MSSVTTTYRPSNPESASLRKNTLKKMSITQTYYLAHKARAKLSREAAQADHDLRLLVGHANLLDSLMIELADAEREQERWFNQSVRGASKSQDRHVQWADRVEEEEYSSDSDSDVSDDYMSEDEDIEMFNDTAPLRTFPSNKAQQLIEEDDLEEDDLEEDYAQLELVRTTSHSSSPPELVDHDSDTSDDESMPPSPPQPVLASDEKDAKDKVEEQDNSSFYEEGFYLPQRGTGSLVSAISVY